MKSNEPDRDPPFKSNSLQNDYFDSITFEDTIFNATRHDQDNPVDDTHNIIVDTSSVNSTQDNIISNHNELNKSAKADRRLHKSTYTNPPSVPIASCQTDIIGPSTVR